MRVSSLMYASRWGSSGVVKKLLAYGADVNANDRYGFTALMYAAMVGNADSVKALIQAGADPSEHNNLGYTALDWAIFNAQSSVIRVLGEVGAIRFPRYRSFKESLIFNRASEILDRMQYIFFFDMTGP